MGGVFLHDASDAIERGRRLLVANRSRMHCGVVVSSLMCHRRGAEGEASLLTSVVALKSEALKSRESLSVKSDVSCHESVSPRCHFLFPPSPLQRRYKLAVIQTTGQFTQITHTPQPSHTHTYTQTRQKSDSTKTNLKKQKQRVQMMKTNYSNRRHICMWDRRHESCMCCPLRVKVHVVATGHFISLLVFKIRAPPTTASSRMRLKITHSSSEFCKMSRSHPHRLLSRVCFLLLPNDFGSKGNNRGQRRRRRNVFLCRKTQ